MRVARTGILCSSATNLNSVDDWRYSAMFIQSRAAGAGVRRDPVGAQPKQSPKLFGLVILLTLGLTITVLGVVSAARMQPIPQMPNLPQAYLPGNPMPQEVSCNPESVWIAVCSVQYEDHEIY